MDPFAARSVYKYKEMASRKTWVWVVVALLGIGLLTLIVVAGAGIYFVTSHIKSEHTTSAEALQSFDRVKATLPNTQPLFELGEDERPRRLRPTDELPTAAAAPETLQLLAWDPESERLIRVSMPLWLIRFGKGRMRLANDHQSLELDRLELDAEELERIGPALLFDVRNHDGTRLLLWTR
jgi:hypothetical protein